MTITDKKGKPLSEKQTAVIAATLDSIRTSPIKDRIQDALLYGSTARGDSKYYSDVDILITVDGLQEMDDNEYDELKKIKLTHMKKKPYLFPELDIHAMDTEQWKNGNDIYTKNIRRDHIKLWNRTETD